MKKAAPTHALLLNFKCVTGTIIDWPHRGYCINRDRLCNSVGDCADGSDEDASNCS